MAGLASLSLLGDDPRAQSWVSDVSDGFPEWFSYSGNVLQNKCANFDRNGAFYESVAYAEYALSEYLLFRLAYQNCYPDKSPPTIPLLETAGDFFVQTCYPRSGSTLSVNFGDGSISASGARTVRLLLATAWIRRSTVGTCDARMRGSEIQSGWSTTRGTRTMLLRRSFPRLPSAPISVGS